MNEPFPILRARNGFAFGQLRPVLRKKRLKRNHTNIEINRVTYVKQEGVRYVVRAPNSLKYFYSGHRFVIDMTEVQAIPVTFDKDQMVIIRSLKGFGTEDAEIVRSIVMAYLSEHNYIKQASIDRDRVTEESDRKYKLDRARGNY